MSVFPLRKSEQDPDADTPWYEVPALMKQLATLADNRYSTGPEVMLFMTGNLKVSITLKRKGGEFRGEGRNPWEAANDLMLNAGIVRDKISDILKRPAGK